MTLSSPAQVVKEVEVEVEKKVEVEKIVEVRHAGTGALFAGIRHMLNAPPEGCAAAGQSSRPLSLIHI